jgi:hypothetical protein
MGTRLLEDLQVVKDAADISLLGKELRVFSLDTHPYPLYSEIVLLAMRRW